MLGHRYHVLHRISMTRIVLEHVSGGVREKKKEGEKKGGSGKKEGRRKKGGRRKKKGRGRKKGGRKKGGRKKKVTREKKKKMLHRESNPGPFAQ